MSSIVFLKAPTASDLKKKDSDCTYHWETVSFSTKVQRKTSVTSVLNDAGDSVQATITQREDEAGWILPPATLEAASQRLSEMYKNVIFADASGAEEDWAGREDEEEGQSGWDDTRLRYDQASRAIAKERTLISWPPTNPEQIRPRASFARTQTLSRVNTNTQYETQEDTTSVSYAHTSASSIAAFPAFVINLHTLTSLSSLIPMLDTSAGPVPVKWTRKVQLLIAVLEVDGPDAVVVKKGPDAGKEIGILKLVIGDENSAVCKLTAWREVAECWGGLRGADESLVDLESEGVRRGDIVYLENIIASSAPPTSMSDRDRHPSPSISLTASPNLASRLHICYRTLPSIPSDRRLRPDLRLAASDPGLRKVANMVNWLQGIVGLGHS